MKSLSGQPSPTRDAGAPAPRREGNGGWTQPPVVSRSGTALCCLKPQRGEMSVAPGPPHPLPFCFSAARRHLRAKGAQAFLPTRGQTARAAPPKNKGRNPGAVAFYKPAAPLGLAAGCASALPKRPRPAVWPSGSRCDSGESFGKQHSAESAAGVPTGSRRREAWTSLPDGRWIERIVSTNNGSTYCPAGTNRYVWDGNVLLAVLDHTNGVVMSFVRGLDLSGTIQGAGGVGGVLAVTFRTHGTHFVGYDGNGNVTALADASTGANSAVFEYGPFGEPLRVTGPAADAMPLRFSTMYEDDVTGDRKYLFREYRPSLGRWPTRDPIGEKGGANLYGFVYNDPLSKIDTDGREVGGICPRCGNYKVGPWCINCDNPPGVGGEETAELVMEGCVVVVTVLTPIPGDEGAALAALGERLAARLGKCLGKCKNVRCRVMFHPAHHPFPIIGKQCHVQVTCWLKGVKGSDVSLRIPVPCPKGKK